MNKILNLGSFIGAALLILVALVASYSHGFGVAKTKGEEKLATYKLKIEEAQRLEWEAYAEELEKAQAEAKENRARADTAVLEILELEERLEAETISFYKRVQDATKNNNCTFSPDFIRLWNESYFGPATP